MSLYVDTSRIGVHGIGRYSREVIGRLDLEWKDLGGHFREPLPVDVFNPRRLSLSRRDVVYAPGFNSGFSRARQLLTIHDLIHLQVASEGSLLKRLYYEHIVKPAVRRSGQVFTVSETSARHISEWLDDDEISVINTGNGVSDDFNVEGPAWAGMSDYFVYVGNLREHKNVDVLLDALALRGEFRLALVSSEYDEAKMRVNERGLNDRVEVLTGIDDERLAEIYRGSLGLVIPSINEGYGLPAAEAIACGRRVAYWSGCESVADIVGHNGVSVDSATEVDEWASALDTLAAQSTEPVSSSIGRWDAVAEVVRGTLLAQGSALR